MSNEDIINFLKELKENNYREWFHNNKKRYDALKGFFLEDVQQLINQIALFDPEVAGVEAKDCLFRIHRDTRFSPDKTPYKIHFAAYIARGGRKSERAGYYLHIEPGASLLSGGIWMPQSDLLKKIRQDVFDQIEEFTGILEEPAFKKIFPALDGDTLKRNPVGFPDSPYNDIIRHKDFCVVSYKPDSFFTNKKWKEETIKVYKKLHTFNKFLNYSVDDHYGLF